MIVGFNLKRQCRVFRDLPGQINGNPPGKRESVKNKTPAANAIKEVRKKPAPDTQEVSDVQDKKVLFTHRAGESILHQKTHTQARITMLHLNSHSWNLFTHFTPLFILEC